MSLPSKSASRRHSIPGSIVGMAQLADAVRPGLAGPRAGFKQAHQEIGVLGHVHPLIQPSHLRQKCGTEQA